MVVFVCTSYSNCTFDNPEHAEGGRGYPIYTYMYTFTPCKLLLPVNVFVVV